MSLPSIVSIVDDVAKTADVAVSAYPNAGLPNEFGQYDATPESMAEHLGTRDIPLNKIALITKSREDGSKKHRLIWDMRRSFVNAVISSLEQRFGLKSTETGVIAGSYDIGSMLSVIPITYFGGRVGASKPKYISWGLLLMGFGSLMFALPHFTTDVYLGQQVKIGGSY